MCSNNLGRGIYRSSYLMISHPTNADSLVSECVDGVRSTGVLRVLITVIFHSSIVVKFWDADCCCHNCTFLAVGCECPLKFFPCC